MWMYLNLYVNSTHELGKYSCNLYCQILDYEGIIFKMELLVSHEICLGFE